MPPISQKITLFPSNSFIQLNVSGSFEIPFVINKNKDLYDGFIALGCIIRGETYHFEIISNQVARKIMDLSISINKPIEFGILTCENYEQALKRAEKKGSAAAHAANYMLRERIRTLGP